MQSDKKNYEICTGLFMSGYSSFTSLAEARWVSTSAGLGRKQTVAVLCDENRTGHSWCCCPTIKMLKRQCHANSAIAYIDHGISCVLVVTRL